MAGTTELIYTGNLNKTGYGIVEVFVNVGYEPYPEGFNPLPDSAFETYEPDEGYSLNTGLRTPLFTGPFLSSPLRPDGDYQYITDSHGYSWLYNTFNYMAIEPFDKDAYSPGVTRYSAALVAPANPGSIQVVINDKNQPQTFAAYDASGRLIDYCFASDSNGNVFIMGSIDTAYAENPVAVFLEAELPKGWSKQVKTLEQDLTIEPGKGDGYRNGYNQFRDNLTNNFFQIEFSANGIGIAHGIPGLPLSGGVKSDLIIGTELNEVIYGAQGNDTLKGFSGDDQIWGDDGDDQIWGGVGLDIINGGTGNDLIRAGIGRDSITGGLGTDELHGDFGWNTYKSEKDGFSDLIAIKSDQFLTNWIYGKAGNNPNGEKADIIEGLDASDRIKIIGVDSKDISIRRRATAHGISGIGIYAGGALEALYTGGDLSVAQLSSMTSGDGSAAALANQVTSYGWTGV